MFRVQVDTKEQADALLAIRESYDFWTEIGIGRNVDIMASPEQLPALTESLDMADIKHDVMIHDANDLLSHGLQCRDSKCCDFRYRDSTCHNLRCCYL